MTHDPGLDGADRGAGPRGHPFVRSVPIEVEIDASRVSATFRKGVLKVTLPKASPGAVGGGRIEVTAG
jgi:HSP20 family molecular chaperone IbpA